MTAPEAKAAARRSAAVVLNGAAGALLDRADEAAALTALFAEAGIAASFIPPGAGTLPERVRLAAAAGAEVVVAAGGDGTIGCAAQTLAGTGTALGILPFGTMNLLARDLGIPLGDPAAAIRVIAEGSPRAIDVAEVNGHVFLCASMLGLPARLARLRERGRGGPAWRLWGRMARAAWRGLSRGSQLSVLLRLGDENLRLRTPSLTVTVGALGDRRGRSFGRPRLASGELALYDIRPLGMAAALRLLLRLLLGRWRGDPAVRERRVRSLAVASNRTALRVMNDGEVRLLRPPLRYRVRPGALRVIAPALRPGPEDAS